ncbi:LysE family translocator [Campylobacter hyointestinalis]|uniref:Homogentisate export protein n=2 Tax=Campylobacter hyointestinalis subsp. hyointestinalis TaxID=91352 RepID=A0A9W5AMQ6_CAMHY|nr:LysE family translocator [Campylobacter hyointestinalis]PPB52999.1 LysE family translocator [Campylobacter hyointestinalis subsp. hyointestinalis]PPB63051.1 LysE family translocator [Campylobacter hyointestinalis subsp. hyointestinalis]PPB65321.1 LysE family translocator [Campylobacter hyointestinalis subsp. hyointestinalis]PPB67394.1 LysE family translocator [Campylobacter hyointestinalis subsp. hyointestinalis]PPB70103.1 LysE family translocator [Campylobacter hyointestinalis subsp. hyoin
MDWLLFITTFWVISLLPGLNMTLALSLGMSVGYKKTLFMIAGATISLGIVAFVCAVSVGAVLAKFPIFFQIFTVICAIYLLYLSYKMFLGSKFNLDEKAKDVSSKALFWQGFMSSNPKAWAFFTALFPLFIDSVSPFGIRLYMMILVLMFIEIIDFNIYALGGVAFKKLLKTKAYLIERVSAVLIAIIAVMMIIERF